LLVTIIRKALEKDRNLRYQHAWGCIECFGAANRWWSSKAAHPLYK
jgi:hypothetical protein